MQIIEKTITYLARSNNIFDKIIINISIKLFLYINYL
jgi:hypothetical protein